MVQRLSAFLLACLVSCYPVLASEVTNDNGRTSELPNVSASQSSAPQNSVSSAPDGVVSDVETVSVPDAESVSPAGDSGASDVDSVSGEEVNDGNSSSVLSASSDSPLPVTVVEPDVVYSAVSPKSDVAPVYLVDSPPDNPPFYGSGYITGTTSNGSTVTLYFPINYKEGYFGTDSNGYLFNVASNSISGYFEEAYNNSVSVSGFSYPRYRTSSQSYDYTTLYIRPTASNMQIATEAAPVVSVNDILPYVSILFLGVIFLCCLRKS